MNWKEKIADRLKFFLNRWSFLRDRVVIVSHSKIEDNAFVLAKYINENYRLPVILILPEDKLTYANSIKESKGLKIIPPLNLNKKELRNYIKVLSSKYIVISDFYKGIPFDKRKAFINIWHGVGHKDLVIPQSNFELTQAKITIATSVMTKSMFADMFHVSEESVIICGLARNDLMLNTKKEKKNFKLQKFPQFNNYRKVVIWMPTFRRKRINENKAQIDVINSENEFNFPGFDVERFNKILKENNALCLVKPHPKIVSFKSQEKFSNILKIDEDWLIEHNTLLYQLLACTDALITDFSSVMIDYSLLDQPIFCVAEDLEEYKSGQGLYFEDFENYVPTEFYKNQFDFLESFEDYLINNTDQFENKRRRVRDLYFKYCDNNSSKRISESFLNNKWLKNKK